ncbi:MAG: SDR family oxidoreductase [Alphaproteobacteria bacterium]|nr:SDR family oxidoreductase [Alphaproteobacteria bacterium]
MSPSRIALVTGAGSGIGRASALALAEAGWSIVLAGRRIAALEETAGLAPTGAAVLVHAADVADPDQVRGLFDAAQAKFGRLDFLFNNAGTAALSHPLEDMKLADWKRVVDVNLTGSFLCLQQAFRLFKLQTPRGGRIVNNGSISAHVPRPGSIAYTATKHGVTGLTRAAALDGRRYGIAVGQIDIGNAASDMTAQMARGMPQADGSVKPEPVMDVAEVARAVVFMAGLPLDANVPFLTIMATGMPYIGRG